MEHLNKVCLLHLLQDCISTGLLLFLLKSYQHVSQVLLTVCSNESGRLWVLQWSVWWKHRFLIKFTFEKVLKVPLGSNCCLCSSIDFPENVKLASTPFRIFLRPGVGMYLNKGKKSAGMPFTNALLKSSAASTNSLKEGSSSSQLK